MEPGRFLSLSVLALGVVTILHAGLEAVLVDGGTLLFLMGLGWCAIAAHRLRGRDGEETPEEYGRWTYVVVLLVGGYLSYLAFRATLSLL